MPGFCDIVWRLGREEDGGALPAVLALITVLVTTAGVIAAINLLQYRLIRRDVHRVEARYAAEAAIYLALDSLAHNVAWQRADTLLPVPTGYTARVEVEPFGGYTVVRSTVTVQSVVYRLRALAGEVPADLFHSALVVTDTESVVSICGRSRVTGSIRVGERGFRAVPYRGRRFVGSVEGEVFRIPDLDRPYFDVQPVLLVLDAFEQMLEDALTGGEEDARPPPTIGLPSENLVRAFASDATLTAADSLWLATPTTVLVRGDLTLEGPLYLPAGTQFVAGGTLRVGGALAGGPAVLYGKQAVVVDEGVTAALQVLSRRRIHVAPGAHLQFPSLLYVAGEGAAIGEGILVDSSAVVDGTVMHARLPEEPRSPRGLVTIKPHALVRGAVFNPHGTQHQGRIHGSLVTHRLYFYDSPTHYVNWLLDAEVDVSARPWPYLLPARFSERPVYEVLAWDGYVRDAEAATSLARSTEAKQPATSFRHPGGAGAGDGVYGRGR